MADGVLALVVSVLCLGLNAFFVAAEFALVKVPVVRIEARAKKGEKRAQGAMVVLKRLDRYLSVTQFGITVASLGLGWVAEPATERLGNSAALALTGQPLGPGGHVAVTVLGLVVLTFFHLLVGELVPKFVAIQFSEKTVLTTALPLRLVDIAFRPVLVVLEKAQGFILRRLGIDPLHIGEGTLSEEEIVGLLAARASPEDQQLVRRVLRFSRRSVRSAMVPRVDVVSVDADATVERAANEVKSHGFSRVLVVEEGSLDKPVGYLYAKDLVVGTKTADRTASVRTLVRRAVFVPDALGSLPVLREMQQTHVPFAVVLDEYGGTAGIVTLEDLVEEVFGEINDELDVEPERVVEMRSEPGTWLVDARATGSELRDHGIPLPEAGEDAPVGRLVVAALGRLPRLGDVARLGGGVVAEIVGMSRRRVRRVRVRSEVVERPGRLPLPA